ncbi:Hypothetical protein CINCED_3A024966 [Cinara cedri]|uniref:Uncharacterized protein n=1 Tax=Cinara cedri TaxID=506608 RepID=A0A5E4NFB3_9HEMI|nr:Hypothetical protein CINCED_3A024966 [Cinara cedri]
MQHVEHKKTVSLDLNYKGKDEQSTNYCKTPVDNTISSNSLNVCNTNGKDKSSTMMLSVNDTSDGKLIESNSSSGLNKVECEFLVNLLGRENLENVYCDSEDVNKIAEIVKKNLKNIEPSTIGTIEINTQQFIDLNLFRAAEELHQLVSKNKDVEIIDDSNISDSSATKQSSVTQNQHKSISTDNFTTNIKFESSNQDLQLYTQDQDPDLIVFKEMCEELSKIKECEKVIEKGSNLLPVQDNTMKQININQVNVNVICCSNCTKYVPSTSKDNSSINFNIFKDNNTIKGLPITKDKCENQTKSFENLNTLSYKHQHKKFKTNTSKNILKINSESHLNNIVNKSSPSNKIGLFNLSSSEDKEYCALSENIKRKKNNIDSLIPNKCKKKIHPTFYSSASGIIHKDMLVQINSKSHSDNIVNKPDVSNTLDLIPLTSSDDEDFVSNEYLYKRSLIENKYSKKIEPIFCCSPYGIIHEDMLNQINNRK